MKYIEINTVTIFMFFLFTLLACSNENQEITNSSDIIGKLIDIDGNEYETISYGNQTWMAENLKVTHYPDGSPIPLISNDVEWALLSDNDVDDAYCFYENDISLDYGSLYTYAAAQNVCPSGWHLPTDEEWNMLLDYLGGSDVAGGKMKTTSGWETPNTGANNVSNFSALPSGFRDCFDGTFKVGGENCNWWGYKSSNDNFEYCLFLGHTFGTAIEVGAAKSTGNSVRCIKD